MADPVSFQSIRDTQSRVRDTLTRGVDPQREERGPETIQIHFVRVTSNTMADGVYPGERYMYDGGGIDQYNNVQTCRVFALYAGHDGSRVALHTGTFYQALFMGFNADGIALFCALNQPYIGVGVEILSVQAASDSVNFTSTMWDTDGMLTCPDQLVAKRDGIYLANANFRLSADPDIGTGDLISALVRLSNTGWPRPYFATQQTLILGGGGYEETYVSVTGVHRFSVGDILQVSVEGNVTVVEGNASMTYLGPAEAEATLCVGSGSGSGSGTSNCCDDPREDLIGTITDATNGYSSNDGWTFLVFDDLVSGWTTSAVPIGGCAGKVMTITCDAGVPKLRVPVSSAADPGCTTYVTVSPDVGYVCNPLTAVYHVDDGGGNTFTFTVVGA